MEQCIDVGGDLGEEPDQSPSVRNESDPADRLKEAKHLRNFIGEPFGHPFGPETGMHPESQEADPRVVADPGPPPMIDRTDFQIALEF